jgi:hypothetical protein
MVEIYEDTLTEVRLTYDFDLSYEVLYCLKILN